MAAGRDPMLRSAVARARRTAPGSRAHAALAARVRAADLSATLAMLRQAASLARCVAARLPPGHPAIPVAVAAAIEMGEALDALPPACPLTD